MAWDLPSAFTAGAVLTAAQMNQVRDSLAYLKGQAGTVTIESPFEDLAGVETTSGFRVKHWGHASVDGTTQTIIADGTGDVAQAVTIFFHVIDSSSDVGGGGSPFSTLKPSQSTVVTTTAGNTITFAVSAGGALTVVRSAGSKTFAVSVWLQWK